MSIEGRDSHRLPLQQPPSQQGPPPQEISSHHFSLETTRLEKEAVAFAISKAEKEAARGVKKVAITAHLICNEAYAEFKKKMQDLFKTSVSKDLMDLTLDSRETLLLVTLKERVKEILDPSTRAIKS